MDPVTFAITLAEGVVLFLALLLLALLVEKTSSAESAGRSISGSARTTAPHN
jgi:hypothetical protein